MDIVQYSLVNTQMFSICCIHCIASTVHTKRNAISPLTESLYVGLVENWGNAHKTVMWVHFGLVQICPNPEIYCHFIRQHRVQTSLFPQNCLSSSHFPPNVPKFLACWQIPPKKMHTICHSKSNFPTSSWRMPWALAGPMPHGRRRCPGLDAKHRRHRCQVLRSGSEVAPTSKPCRIELRMTSC